MRGGSKTLVAAVVAALLALGLVACGGDDDSDSTATTAATQEQPAGEGEPNGGGSSADDAKGGGDAQKAGSGSGAEKPADTGDSDGESAEDFVPKEHDDSGGGSEQFRSKGGDNSIQEFGEEVTDSEFEEAATVLHNFLDARAEGHWAAACSYLASTITESLEKLAGQAKEVDATDCAGILEKLTNPAAMGLLREEAQLADVASVRVEDDRAFVIYKGIEGKAYAISLVDEDGEWKVGGLAGTVLN